MPQNNMVTPPGVKPHEMHANVQGRILVVEDEVLIQMLLQDFLEELGFQADLAGSAAAAMRHLQTQGDGIVAAIVDFGLPDMKGDELVWTMRQFRPALPVLIASGHDKTILDNGHLDGLEAVGFVGKPYTLQEMQTALSAVGILPKSAA